jgi:hypothetical protein
VKPLLSIGDVMRLKHQGLCEYLGTDTYMGQVTFRFRRLDYGDETYILPHTLSDLMNTEPQTGVENG